MASTSSFIGRSWLQIGFFSFIVAENNGLEISRWVHGTKRRNSGGAGCRGNDGLRSAKSGAYRSPFYGLYSSISAAESLKKLDGCSSKSQLSSSIRRGKLSIARAVAEQLASSSREEELSKGDVLVEEQGATGKVQYNWLTEWYPMYLTAEVPRDSPLGLTVFDRSVVLFYDGDGKLHCFEDRCPHRLAKLSEGQIIDGKLECLYHGWQFEGSGACTKIPQLPAGAKIPLSACAKAYAVKESQGVVWAWMGDKDSADYSKLPYFEHVTEDSSDISTVHEMPYDYAILLENLLDPAHIPISHDRTDVSALRENAQALKFEVTERTDRGFRGKWDLLSSPTMGSTTRFEAPCVARNDKSIIRNGETIVFNAQFLCRPSGQGKSMLILRFVSTPGQKSKSLFSPLRWMPKWVLHSVSCKVFEQDMGFLSSQNAALVSENVPTKDLYLSLRSSDTWVTELRKWLDKAGHGMPYYVGHRTVGAAAKPALLEAAPVGFSALHAYSYPSKGGVGSMFAPNLSNRYWRHVVHCKSCRETLKAAQKFRKVALVAAGVIAALAIAVSSTPWRVALVVVALLSWASSWAASQLEKQFTQNFLRSHRQ